MKKIKLLLVGLIVVLAFTQVAVTSPNVSSYDPWLDLNDDGIIDVNDLQILALIYATSGEAINKTALLLELEARLDSLNASLLTDYYNKIESDVIFVDASGDTITGYLDVDSGTLYVDDVNNRVGIGKTNPIYTLDVDGTLKADQIRLGSVDGNHVIYFFEGGAFTEYFYWQDSGDRFILSDETYIDGPLEVDGSYHPFAVEIYATAPHGTVASHA